MLILVPVETEVICHFPKPSTDYPSHISWLFIILLYAASISHGCQHNKFGSTTSRRISSRIAQHIS